MLFTMRIMEKHSSSSYRSCCRSFCTELMSRRRDWRNGFLKLAAKMSTFPTDAIGSYEHGAWNHIIEIKMMNTLLG